MKIEKIDKNTNNAIVKYNGKDTLIAEIIGFKFFNKKLVCMVKLPDWCTDENIISICVEDKFEIKEKL